MKLVNTIVALSAFAASVAFAGGKKDPNCEVAGKPAFHAKDEAACTKKKGTWTAKAAAEHAAPAAGAEHAAPAAAPAEAAPAK